MPEQTRNPLGFNPAKKSDIEDFILSSEVAESLAEQRPVVALESTILAHGLPYPDNIAFATKAETLVRENGATPATIAILNGKVHIGLEAEILKALCDSDSILKTSRRDIPIVTARKLSGATTVSATMHLAHCAGIKVFATGGIGGVHRNAVQTFDLSQDLFSLAQIPMVVVSAGAKAILDLAKTVEALETLGVPVIGYRTEEFPSFYSRTSGIHLEEQSQTPEDIALIFRNSERMGLTNSLLIANPIPRDDEIPATKVEGLIEQALTKAATQDIAGKTLTPFLLNELNASEGGKLLQANIALALNNATLASQIACAYSF